MPPFFFRLPNPKLKLKSNPKASSTIKHAPRIAAFPGILEFPCKNWDGVEFPYPGTHCTYREKAIWAGRAASKRVAWAFEHKDFFSIDNVDFAVAVFDKTQELLRYLGRSDQESKVTTTEEWIQFTDWVIAYAAQIAYKAVEPHLSCLPPPRKFGLSDVYPFVRPAVNAQFEFGNADVDDPPGAAPCHFDDSWAERYFPNPRDLPLRKFTMAEVNLIPVNVTGFIEEVGWYNHSMQRCKTPSPEEQKRQSKCPIPQDGDWPPTNNRDRVAGSHTPIDYSLVGYNGSNSHPSTQGSV
ncbi:hypothetical protein CspeluHIS016_0106120 [Cutaneotrichosporon spelunceum]|uniref:Uncharacterized protein n=1 Tax=Cutaneotrichosporon spelunceum TaxID=1672016 RepID=A0AAD3TNB8_9TREE|nr:hypothetical protein CspeluHIS016_0106120 [Cutaneotrichosporon spelunceum]